MKSLSLNTSDQLNYLGFQRFAPHPYLRSWVQCYWVVSSVESIVSEEKLYPDGCTSLTIDFTSSSLSMQFNAIQTLNRLQLKGTLDRMGIRFHPGGAFQLLGLDMGELANRECSLQDLGFTRLQVQEQLSGAANISQRLELLDSWLLQESIAVKAECGLVQRLLPHLLRSENSIEELSRAVALSRRQLERKFLQQVGLTAVKLKQLVRIKQARLSIGRAPDTPLTKVALDAGFYDQSHFIRQFQLVTEQTPGQYRQRKMSQKYNYLL